jgi:hypothetical protein
LPLDAEELARVTVAVDDSYQQLWTGFTGTPAQFAVYTALDRARLALLQGRLSTARAHLGAVETLLDNE